MSEPYLPCNHPVVERMHFFEDRLTHLHACSAIHVPSSPPSPAIHSRRFSSAAFLDCVLYLQVFFASRVCLHFLPLQRASHPSQILRNGALFKVKSEGFFLLVEHTRGLSSLTRKKEMPFRMWPVGVFWCEVQLMIIELISLKQVTSHLLTASPGELFWEC